LTFIVGGEAVERLIGPGQVIQGGGTQCVTISNLQTVWVLAAPSLQVQHRTVTGWDSEDGREAADS